MTGYYSDDVISLAYSAKVIHQLLSSRFYINGSADMNIQEYFRAALPNTMPYPFIMPNPPPARL
jgi:hypothetical protein